MEIKEHEKPRRSVRLRNKASSSTSLAALLLFSRADLVDAQMSTGERIESNHISFESPSSFFVVFLILILCFRWKCLDFLSASTKTAKYHKTLSHTQPPTKIVKGTSLDNSPDSSVRASISFSSLFTTIVL